MLCASCRSEKGKRKDCFFPLGNVPRVASPHTATDTTHPRCQWCASFACRRPLHNFHSLSCISPSSYIYCSPSSHFIPCHSSFCLLLFLLLLFLLLLLLIEMTMKCYKFPKTNFKGKVNTYKNIQLFSGFHNFYQLFHTLL